jgi:hypothetical protein
VVAKYKFEMLNKNQVKLSFLCFVKKKTQTGARCLKREGDQISGFLRNQALSREFFSILWQWEIKILSFFF